MAFVTTVLCTKCNKSWQGVLPRHGNALCITCKTKEKKKEKDAFEKRKEEYFLKLNELTVEERIRKLEDWVFNQQK